MYSATEQLIRWLTAKGYSAYSYPPKTGTGFITVERTGGSVADMVDHPTMAIQAWAATEADAEAACLAIREMLVSGDTPKGFYRVEAESMYPWYDEETRCPRYQLVINATTQLTM